VSNFLLWQIAYTEFFITDAYWPDFTRKHLYEAIKSFQKRERRFGKVSEQIKQNGKSTKGVPSVPNEIT
jgi:undecaprenyl diphosphate synthase